MAHTAARAEIRAALHAAGILTKRGEIAGTWIEAPDAPLFAMLAEHELHWSVYLATYDQKGKSKADRERMHEYWQTARRLQDIIAAMPAITLEGVRAKAAFGVDRLTGGGRGDGGVTSGLLVSALRDAIRGPTTPPAPAPGNVVRLADHRADGALIARLEELETAREIGRPAEPLTMEHSGLLSPERLAALRRWIALEAEIAGMPASTTPGITGKLQAAISRRAWPETLVAASAARDFMRLWEEWA